MNSSNHPTVNADVDMLHHPKALIMLIIATEKPAPMDLRWDPYFSNATQLPT